MRLKTKYHIFWLALLLFCLLHAGRPASLYAEKLDRLKRLVGKRDAVLVADSQGNILFSENSDKKLIPASTLKILTSLAAMHYLGPDFRFVTEFYTDSDSNLKIKGYGDPLLISEVVAEISETLGTRLETYNDLVLDHSYFDPIIIPGVTTTLNPYDAPNGALCANFNTVYFKRRKGGYVSAEPQTPLLPFAVKKIKKLGLRRGRVIFSREEDEITLYAGHLFRYFLEKEGVKSHGTVRLGTVRKDIDTLLFRYVSKYPIEAVISKLLKHSNNFIANQTFVVSGIKSDSPPGTLEKGVRAVSAYMRNALNLNDIRIAEGSGISRENRISAKNMYRLLQEFEPYHGLMRHEGREFYKTGSLSGVKTRAGYIEDGKGGLYRFVVMINTPGKSTSRIMSRMLNALR
ncbi:D-alanyl-D-alanine carboxypeptidase [Desulfobacterales bacterium HSG2]|nr:D-alanyl-D-alanine carboxypeptidase [Desulfobacterales bacterium HSG2]